MNHVVSVGGVDLLAGLYWARLQAHQRKRKVVREELNEQAAEYQHVFGESAKLGVLFSTGIDILAGVGESPEGIHVSKKSKTRSLACLALIANPEARSFLGRLRISEDYDWIAVVRSGIISPVGDLVVGVEESDEAFSTLRSRNDDLSVKFDERDVNASAQVIGDWLAGTKPRKIPQVRAIGEVGAPPLTTKNMLLYGLLATVLVSGAYIAHSQYRAYIDTKAAQEEARRQAALSQINSRGPIPTPWKEKPHVSAVAAACFEHYQQRKEYKLGWREERWSCDGSTVDRVWRRTEIGSYTHLPVEEGFNLSDPNTLTHSQSLGNTLSARGDQAVAQKNEVGKVIMDAARLHGLSIDLEWGGEETRTYMDGEQEKVERLGYSVNTATMQGEGVSALAIIETLSKIPGMHLERVSSEGGDISINIQFYTAV